MSGLTHTFAIIAGSGFSSFGEGAAGKSVRTEFGKPSAPIRELQYADHAVFYLPRHGDDMLVPPHAINYRANLMALKQLGVDSVVSLNTVGVITADLHPGHVALPD